MEIFSIKKHSAFTLAETLLSTAIIAVIASLVIPTLNRDYNQNTTITKLDKTLTQLESCHLQNISTNGNPKLWSTSTLDDQTPIDYFLKGVDVIKICEPNTNCPSTNFYTSLDGTTFGPLFRAKKRGCGILNDGSFICIDNTKNSCTSYINGVHGVCGSIYIDTNGTKGPNRFGMDTFRFYYTENRIVPAGMTNYNLVMFCNKEYKHPLNGFDCTSWVLEKNNFDFLEKSIH